MENNITVFETGATSPAVNELILYTDNTRELVELRDKIYESCKSGKISPYNMHYQFYYDFYKISAHWYETEIASETVSAIKLSSKEQNEFATIYANRFPEWKRERERNQR